MARITPAADFTLDLKDYEPYEVTLAEDPESISGSEQFGGERRLQLTWELPDGQTVRDWLGFRLGKQQGGQVSKLRSLLNALSERKEDESVAWFDDETFEWSYDSASPADNVLRTGVKVIIRGKNVIRESGGRSYRITTYQSATPF